MVVVFVGDQVPTIKCGPALLFPQGYILWAADGVQVIDMLHRGWPNVSKVELKEKLAKGARCRHSFRWDFSCLIYDSLDFAKKYEPKYRLIKNGLASKVEKSRKQVKERKNRAKKLRGTKKNKAAGKAAKKKK
ncbi:unnamed protein product [Calypogeia fissa]